VATLVARGASPAEVFGAVADEMAHCVHVSHATVTRYDAEGLIPVALYYGDRLRKLPEGTIGTRHGRFLSRVRIACATRATLSS
jgi:predicted site-specific integrase-resolvase